MRKFLISVPVSAMIGKQGTHFTTAKIFKKVCKTLFVTVTILSPNFCLTTVASKSRHSPVANMTHLDFLYKVFFELFLNHFLVLIPNPVAARPKRLSVFLKIDKFKMAAW